MEIERSLLAMNPIRLRLDGEEAQAGIVKLTLSDDRGHSLALEYQAGKRYGDDYYVDVDLSPVIRSLLMEAMSRDDDVKGAVTPFGNAVMFTLSLEEGGSTQFVSVFGQYLRPYADDDFTFASGRLLTQSRRLTAYRGLPWCVTLMDFVPGDSVMLVPAKGGDAISFQQVDIEVTGFIEPNNIAASNKDFYLALLEAVNVFNGWFVGMKFRYEFDYTAFAGYGMDGNTHVKIVAGKGEAGQDVQLTLDDIVLEPGSGHYSGTVEVVHDKIAHNGMIYFFCYSGEVRIQNLKVNIIGVDTSSMSDVALASGGTIGAGGVLNVYGDYHQGQSYCLQFLAKSTTTQGESRNPSIAELSVKIGRSQYEQAAVYQKIPVACNQQLQWTSLVISGMSNEPNIMLELPSDAASPVLVSELRLYKIEGPPYADWHPLENKDVTDGMYKVVKSDGTDSIYPRDVILEVVEAPMDCIRSGKMAYFRYLNSLGGWGFALLSVIERSVKSKGEYVNHPVMSLQPVQGSMEADRMMLSMEVENGFTAGTDRLSLDEVDELAGLARSVMVDMWDASNGCWMPVYPTDVKIKKGWDSLNEVSIDFETMKGGF